MILKQEIYNTCALSKHIGNMCMRYKRNYTKSTNEYWSDIIFKQRAAKKTKISEDMSLVSDKYSENNPVPCSIDDLSITEIRDELKKIGAQFSVSNVLSIFELVRHRPLRPICLFLNDELLFISSLIFSTPCTLKRKSFPIQIFWK
jgi:hypothetical protein